MALDLAIRIPLFETSPYLALHVKHFGWQCGARQRQIFVVMLMWGRFFMSPQWSGYRSWYPQVPIKRLMFF